MLNERIRELREERNISQRQLADRLGFERYTVSNWEQGRTEPNVRQLTALADFFEVSTDYLMCRANELGIVEVTNALPPQQKELLGLFERMSQQDRNRIVDIAKVMLK